MRHNSRPHFSVLLFFFAIDI